VSANVRIVPLTSRSRSSMFADVRVGRTCKLGVVGWSLIVSTTWANWDFLLQKMPSLSGVTRRRGLWGAFRQGELQNAEDDLSNWSAGSGHWIWVRKVPGREAIVVSFAGQTVITTKECLYTPSRSSRNLRAVADRQRLLIGMDCEARQSMSPLTAKASSRRC
jgi:hypothetical protein